MLELKWNGTKRQYESDLYLEETILAFDGYIGYVYPYNEDSYFINSGGNCKLSVVHCYGGEFYGDSEVCESLCVGLYIQPKPSKEVVAIADALENKLHEDLRS